MTAAAKKIEKENTTAKRGEILIDKIKIEHKKATINYHKTTDFDDTTTVYVGKEEVTEDFLKAFEGCTAGFASVMPELKTAKMTMNCLSFTYDKSNEIEKALYSVKYKFHYAGNQVINLNTPQLPIYKDNFDEKTLYISGKDVDAFYTVIDYAKKYINGDTRTKQMKLVVDNTDSEAQE